MKIKIIIILLFIYFLRIEAYGQLIMSLDKDTSIVSDKNNSFTVYLINKYDYPLIIPKGYVAGSSVVNYKFDDSNIRLQYNSHETKIDIEWSKLSNEEAAKIIKRNCNDVEYLLPEDTLYRRFNLYGYMGFKKGKIYRFEISYSNEEIVKDFCPYLWSGSVKPIHHYVIWNSENGSTF